MEVKISLVFKLILPFVLGIICAYYFQIYIHLGWIIGIALVLFLFSINEISKYHFLKGVFGKLAYIYFFFLGIYLVHIHDSRNNENFYGHFLDAQNMVQFKIIDTPLEKENTIKCEVDIQKLNEQPVTGKALVYIEKTEESRSIEYGDVILSNCKFNEIKTNGNPYEFNYSSYLEKQNIHYQSYLGKDSWTKMANDGNGIKKGILDLRTTLSSILDNSGMKPENLMVAKALILGEKNDLDENTRSSFATAGAMHILAVSGLHVGIIMLILSFFLKPIKKINGGKTLFVCLMLFGIWCYAFITGLSPSVLRASVMFSFIIVGSQLQRETNIYQSILVSAFLLLIIDPLLLFNVGFQLSYLAVIGIVYFQPKIYNLIFIENKIINKIWQLSAVSIAAQIATFPISIYYFHQFPNYFLLANIFVIPLAFIILLLGLIYLTTNFIPIVSEIVLFALDWILSILNSGVKWIESIPYSLTNGFSIYWFETILLYLIIVLTSIAFVKRKPKFLITSMVSIVFLLLFNIYEKSKFEDSNQMVFYNVNKEVAIDVFYGNRNIFIGSEGMVLDEKKMLFHVKNNWYNRKGNNTCDELIVLDNDQTILKIGGQNCLFISSENIDDFDLFQFPITEMIYLHNIEFLDQSILSFITENKIKLILGSYVGYKLKNMINKVVPNQFVHNLKEDGAMILKF